MRAREGTDTARGVRPSPTVNLVAAATVHQLHDDVAFYGTSGRVSRLPLVFEISTSPSDIRGASFRARKHGDSFGARPGLLTRTLNVLHSQIKPDTYPGLESERSPALVVKYPRIVQIS